MMTEPPQQVQLPPVPTPAPTALSSGGITVTEQLPATGAEREVLYASIGGGLVMAGFALRRLSRRPV
jgi:LPXTG-motif cell wall-anchored protein